MLLGLGVLIQIAVDLWIGTKLLLLARRTRGLPELGFGLCLLLFGGIGMPLAVVARAAAADAPALGHGLLTLALGLENAGSFALFVATWKVFRPDSSIARAFVWLAAAAFVVSTPVSGSDGGLLYWLGCAFRGLAFFWSATESIRYGAMLRRRRALGLAEPIVVQRMALWALSCTACSIGFLVFVGVRALGVDPNVAPVMIVQSTVATISGAALWLAFAPPAWYRARFAGLSTSAGSTAPR